MIGLAVEAANGVGIPPIARNFWCMAVGLPIFPLPRPIPSPLGEDKESGVWLREDLPMPSEGLKVKGQFLIYLTNQKNCFI